MIKKFIGELAMGKKQTTILITFFILLLLGYPTYVYAASNTNIIGTVKDATTGEPLIGANLIILGTSLGSSTDIDGKYRIQNVPFGEYTLRVTYIGYKQQETSLNITSEKTIEINISLKPDVIEGESVVISTQREGQIEAINQQINSDAIKNIVSSDKIQELPESNVAEAVGRLPGISLLREGGEGNKVVIRGLAPKYNKVQVDGVDLVATDSDNRSTDLSMISAYMLDGIEVTKSALADQEADQLGGTVNFVLKGAPIGEPKFKLLTEGGYNGLRNEYKDYRLVGLSTLRVLDDLVGISLNVNLEKRNRSSNTASADYYYLREDNKTVVNSLNVEDITRDLNRYGGSILLDYKTASTSIVMSNMISRINRTTLSRYENSTGLFTSETGRSQQIDYGESNTTVLVNQLRLEQTLGNFKLESSISYSYSKDQTPREISFGGLEASPLIGPVNPNASPQQIPNFMKNDTSAIYLGPFYDSNTLTKEEEVTAHLDLEWNYGLSDEVNMILRAGGEFKHKDRKYDFNTVYLNIFSDPSGIVTDALFKKYPYMRQYYTSGKFPYEPFIDFNYNSDDFLKGEFKLQRVPNFELGKEVINYLEDYLGIDYAGSTTPQKFTPNFHTSRMDDYNGQEDYSAAYIMPKITIGKEITFIPGVRYEHNETRYNGIRGNENLQIAVSKGYVYYDTTVTRKNDFILPMIHLKYKPVEWFDVRASYTQTLARPDYNQFLPSWNIYMDGIDYKNPNLKPAKSENYDLYLSFYGNKIGLFTLGLFAKRIKDLVFSWSEIIISDSMAVEKYGLLQSLTGQDPVRFAGKPISSYINNPNLVDIKGIEVEWQSNLWYLPGLLKNIVFGINYTYTYSNTKYPRTVPIKKIVSSPFGNIEKIVGNADSSYSAPMLFQPDNILNITLGYDYEGFSIRASMQYKSKIFSQNDWRPELRGFTNGFSLFDLAVSQKLPIEGLQVYGNLNNISRVIEGDYNVGTGYMTNREYYGMSGSLGLKYQF